MVLPVESEVAKKIGMITVIDTNHKKKVNGNIQCFVRSLCMDLKPFVKRRLVPVQYKVMLKVLIGTNLLLKCSSMCQL